MHVGIACVEILIMGQCGYKKDTFSPVRSRAACSGSAHSQSVSQICKLLSAASTPHHLPLLTTFHMTWALWHYVAWSQWYVGDPRRRVSHRLLATIIQITLFRSQIVVSYLASCSWSGEYRTQYICPCCFGSSLGMQMPWLCGSIPHRYKIQVNFQPSLHF